MLSSSENKSFGLRSPGFRDLIGIAVLAIVYWGAAELGLSLAFTALQVSVVWPPTGIALAALLLWGFRLWPGITLGAFAANAMASEPLMAAVGISIGNTLEAVAGAWLLRRFVDFDPALARRRDVLGLIFLAALATPPIAATIGVTSLCLTGVQPWPMAGLLWRLWFLGDMMGILVVGPLILTWKSRPFGDWSASKGAEFAALLALLFVVCSLAYMPHSLGRDEFLLLGFLIIPLVIWAGARLGPSAAAWTTALASGIAILGIRGRIIQDMLPASDSALTLIQIYMGAVAVTGLAIAATSAERKESAARLRDSEARLRLAHQAARAGSFEWNIKTGVNRWTPELETMYGLAPGSFGGTQEAWAQLVHPNDRERILQGVDQAMQGGSFEDEWRVIWPDGTVHWISGRASVIKDTNDNPLSVIGLNIEITERKLAEQAQAVQLRVSQALAEAIGLEDALESILRAVCEVLDLRAAVVWNLDPRSQALTCSHFWCDPSITNLGLEAEMRRCSFARGVPIPGKVLASGKPAWIPDLRREGNIMRGSLAVSHGLAGDIAIPLVLGGEPFGVMEFFSSSPIGPPADVLIGILTNVGVLIGEFLERKDAEISLRNRERELADFFENASEGLHWAGADGRMIRANRAELEMLGYARDEYIGRHISEFHEDPKASEELLRRVISGETVIDFPARLRRKDGSCADVIISSSGYREDDQFIHTMCFTRDITRRKEAEEALRAANQELIKADQAKDHFLAVLGHELRNPLATISGAVELMELSQGEERGEELQSILGRETKQLSRLLDDLLDAARIRRGSLQLQLSPFDLGAVVEEAARGLAPTFEEAAQRLTIKRTQDELPMEADPARMKQLTVNLLNNASKYTDRGGEVRLELRREGESAVMNVRDSGVGIAKEDLASIFDLFSQAAPPLDGKRSGLGIGLSLVKEIANLHGGRVEARSDGRGCGSEFIVTLPLAASSAAERPAPPKNGGNGSCRAFRVLVVDDTHTVANLFGMMIRALGHEALIAVDAHAALRLIETERPEIVFSDISMPAMDGYEFARRVRADPENQALTLIALTGFGGAPYKQRALEAGFDLHLVKPVQMETLRELLASISTRRHATAS